MALQYVGGTSGSGTTTGYTVSLSGTLTGGIASSPAVGDIVLVCSAFGNTAASAPEVSGNISGAYTALQAASHVNDTWDTEFLAAYKVMAGTADSTLTITRATNAAYGGATVVHVWRGQSTTAPINQNATTATTTNASRGNPPAVTSSVDNGVAIAFGAGTQTTAGAAFTVSAGMSNAVSVNADGTTADIGVWIASNTVTNGVAYDPAAWTGGTTSTSCSAAAKTIVLAPEPPAALTLDSTPGSLAYTGSSATVARTHLLSSTPGSYAYTGADADLTYIPAVTAYDLDSTPANYSYTGSSATLSLARVLASTPASYSYTGSDVSLVTTKVLTSTPASYAYTGTSVELAVESPNKLLETTPGAYAYTGAQAALVRTHLLATTPGSYSYTGSSATVGLGRVINTTPGAYTLTGSNGTLLTARVLSSIPGSYALSGATATLTYGRQLQVIPGAYAYTGVSATLNKTGLVWPTPGQVLLGVTYGPTGTEYTGTFVGYSDSIKLDLSTGRLVKLISDKVVLSL